MEPVTNTAGELGSIYARKNKKALLKVQYQNLVYLTLPSTGGGGHNDPPYQLWSLTAPKVKHGLVQYPYEFGHMGGHYDPDPKNVSNFQ